MFLPSTTAGMNRASPRQGDRKVYYGSPDPSSTESLDWICYPCSYHRALRIIRRYAPHQTDNDGGTRYCAPIPFHCSGTSCRPTFPVREDTQGRVESWRLAGPVPVFSMHAPTRAYSRQWFPTPPHQTVRSVFPNTAFQSSSSKGFRLRPWRGGRYSVEPYKNLLF